MKRKINKVINDLVNAECANECKGLMEPESYEEVEKELKRCRKARRQLVDKIIFHLEKAGVKWKDLNF